MNGRRGRRQRTSTALGATAAALLLLLSGCSADEQARTEVPDQQQPQQGQEQEDGPLPIREELRRAIALPDFYPEDAPIYPNATLSNVGQPRGRVTAVFSTEDPPEEVTAYLRAKLATEGWSEHEKEEMPNGLIIQATKDERAISLLISSMDAGTEYELTMVVVAIDP